MGTKKQASQGRENGLSRRSFIVGAGMACAGLGLAACSPAASGSGADASADTQNAGSGASPASWDHEADFLVVGSGTAAIGALAATDAEGKSVMLIEKSDGLFGGTSTTSGGGFWTPMNKWQADVDVTDSREAAISYITGCGGGRTDQATVEAFVDTAHIMMEWLSDTTGVEFAVGGAHDYYDNVEGFLNYGRNSKVKSGKAGDIWNAIQAKLQERGCEILMGTSLSEFYTDADGNVIGVKAKQSNKDINIKAGAVLLGTGGFDHDPDMVRENLPAPIFYSNAAQTNTGDGHRAAGRINAKLGLMSFIWAMPNFFPGKPDMFDPSASVQFDIKGNDFNRYRGYPNSMIVNKRGHRFGDESATYPVYNMSLQNYSSDTLTYENVPAYFVCDATYVETYKLPSMDEGDASWFVSADTIEELAGKLGIDGEALAAEVATFNGYAQTGVDEAYHRGEKQSSKSAWLKNIDRPDLPNPMIGPIDKAPFYGAVYLPAMTGTCGGVKINERAQVVNNDGKVIGGLYACGNCTASIAGGAYLGGGATLCPGATMGYIAAHDALGIG